MLERYPLIHLQDLTTNLAVFYIDVYLAVHLSMKPVRHFLEGRDFDILTDHKPLTFAFRCNRSLYWSREILHFCTLEFTTNLQYFSVRIDTLMTRRPEPMPSRPHSNQFP